MSLNKQNIELIWSSSLNYRSIDYGKIDLKEIIGF